MGFLSNLFGGSKSNNAPVDNWNSAWNKLFDEAQAIENDFNIFMQTNGITQDVYIFDVELVNKGRSSVEAEKRRLDSIKVKIQEFVAMGGCAKYIISVDKMDEYLEKIRYMKEKDIMAIHTELINLPLQSIKEIVESVESEKNIDVMSNSCNINSLSGTEFEVVCKQLVEKMGFVAEMTKATGDGGIDIIAYNYQPLLSGKYIIQCKRYSGSVGEPIIRDLYGVVTSERANKGILMTTGTFTTPAIRFAEGKPLELIDHSKLNDLFNQYGFTNLSVDSEELMGSIQIDTAGIDFDWESHLLEYKLDWTEFFDDHMQLNPESVPYFNYEQFEYWKGRLQQNPADLIAYWKLIEICYSSLTKLNSNSVSIREFFLEEIDLLSDMICFLIRPFLSERINIINVTDKNFKCIIFYSHLFLAYCQLWNGNLFGAIVNWNFAVENWIYDDGIKRDLVIYSIIACMNMLELYELANSYYAKYKCDIDITKTARRQFLADNDWLIEFNKCEYDCHCFLSEDKEIHTINTVLTVAFPDYISADSGTICDYALELCLISEIPDFIVRNGTSLILQKWEEPIENGKVIGDIERCHFDKQKILEFFLNR